MYPLLKSLNTYSVKMYKSHIAKWGLDKKNKEPEMRAIVRKNKQRAGQGKRSNFLVRKRQLDFAEVVRYWQRKGMTIDEVVARSIASPTPEAIECFTPPVTSPMTLPEDLANPEYILRIIRGYIAASFESGIWVKTDPWDGCYSIKDGRNADWYCEFADLSNLAVWSFSTHNFEEAEKSMSDSFAISRKIIIAEQPDLLPVFLRRMVCMPRTRGHEIALRIIHQLSTTSKELLGEKHPLCLFWTRFAAIPWSQTEDIISRCFHVITDDFESLLGPVHRSTWGCRLSISELDINLAILRKLVNTCESALGSYDGRTLHVRVWLMDCTFKTGHYAEAKRLGEDILASLHEIQEVLQSYSDWWFSISSWEIIARCQYALGEPHLAIQSLEVAVHLGIMNYLAQAEPLSTLIITLERWYIEQGQMNEAIAARNRWFKFLKGPTLRGAFQNGLGGLTERMRIERQIENHR